MPARTLFDKVWSAHEVVAESPDTPAVLYIDLHLVHEVTTPQAFSMLRTLGLPVRRPDRTLATMDHSTPTHSAQVFGSVPIKLDAAARQVRQLQENAAAFGIELFGMQDSRRGIVHVIGPELGCTQPGMTIVCGDSHTSTHGAFGAFAFGIGSTEVGHVFATQALLQRKPKTLALNVEGALARGVTAKDLILAIIGRIGVSGGTGYVLEYRGSTVRGLSMHERMTVCNMSIEAGARAGMIAPDEVTLEYLKDKPRVPRGANWDSAVTRWRELKTDPGARFDACVDIDAAAVEPMITYGTNPGMVVPIGSRIPDRQGDEVFEKALRYMGFRGGERMLGKPVNVVFIGSCTNGRLEDLQAAAQILKGRKVAQGVRLLIVPGSQRVKQQAEASGIAEILKAAGADWRESGCSMCLGMNGDTVGSGQYSVSTSNRNFEGRQGKGARTLLASPLTAAASAVTGRIADPRELL
ncbi:MAG TPA: 3-isopropylmalate dehydratase large subunit [Steroidobacteraceae bacterium]|nr:3-isopropylmalate dehydratase large subunit [Steroidobacteraceae bacterium]